MYAPTRLLYSLRPHASPGVIAGAVSVAVLFAATPFVIPEVSTRLGVTLGAAGLISTAKVGGFAVTNLIAPRLLRPSQLLIRVGAAIAVIANLASALAGSFALLMALRLTVGAAAGLLTWVAWTDAMTEPRSMRDIAAAGPMAALTASPVIGLLVGWGDDRIVYLMLAVVMAVPLFLPARLPAGIERIRTVSNSRSNRVLLGALFMLTTAGSSLFVFLGALGTRRLGLSAFVVSLGFSLNAFTGILGTRKTAREGTAGRWLLLTGVSAIAVTTVTTPLVFYAGLALWGYAFWLGIPEVMRALRARSLTPAERTGDAQAVMAFGRTIGPIVGGALLGSANFALVGVTAGIGLAVASAVIAWVERYRATSPTGAS